VIAPTTRLRPPRTCHHCRGPAPLDAIRLRHRRLYCRRPDCTAEAERIILDRRAAQDAERARRESRRQAREG
jgi:hypothetical protein